MGARWHSVDLATLPSRDVSGEFCVCAICSDAYFSWELYSPGLFDTWPQPGDLIVTHREKLYRFVKESGSWEAIFSDDQGFNVRVSDSAILTVIMGQS